MIRQTPLTKYERWLAGKLPDSEIFGTRKRRMAYKKPYSSKLPKLPDSATAVNLLILGVVGFGGYKLYNMFSSSPNDEANDKADSKAAETKTSAGASQSTKLQKMEKTLLAQGYKVNTVHIGSADYLHSLMNAVVVQQSKVVSAIKGMSFQTLQLVAIAYGRRNLSVYANHHMFNWSSWSLDNLFSSEKNVGDLREHLSIVLDSKSESQISSNLKYI